MSSIPQERECTRCKRTFPYTDTYFMYKRGGRKLADYCRACALEAKRKLDNEKSKRWRERHPEQMAACKKRWNETNPDKVRQHWKDSVARNPDRKRENRRRSQRNNREAARIRNRRYSQRHPDLIRVKTLNRVAMFKKADGKFTPEDIEHLYKEQQERCAYCGITLHGHYEIDHVHPLSRDGSNWPDNLILACPSCNSSKNNLTVEEWEAKRGW